MIIFIKQQLNKLINEKGSQINKDRKSNLLFLQRNEKSQGFWLKLVKNRQKNITKGLIFIILGTSQWKNIDEYGSIYTANRLHLLVNHARGYIERSSTEEKNGNKYLIFDDSVDENKELLKKYADVWDEIKNKIKAINGGEENDYGKHYTKIKFNSDGDLPLSKPLKPHAMTIIIRSVFENGKLSTQVFLDDALHELGIWKMLEYDTCLKDASCKQCKIYISKRIDDNKTSASNNAIFVTIGILSINHILAMVVKKLRSHDLMMLLLFMLKEILTEFTFDIWAKMMQLA